MVVTVIQNAPMSVAASEPQIRLKVDLDERCYLFPDGKVLNHLLLCCYESGVIGIDAVYAFNNTRRPPRIVEFSLDEARGFVRELVNAVYYAKPAFFLAETVRCTCNVAANGYHIEVTRADEGSEIMLSTGVIWRVIKALLAAVDSIAPVSAN